MAVQTGSLTKPDDWGTPAAIGSSTVTGERCVSSAGSRWCSAATASSAARRALSKLAWSALTSPSVTPEASTKARCTASTNSRSSR